MGVHVREIGHLLSLQHSAVNGETSVYDNAYDDMSSMSHWFWTDALGNWSFFCDGYGYVSPLMKCVWPNTDGQKHLPVESSVYQKLRLGWIHSGLQDTDTRVISGPNSEVITLNAEENGPVSMQPRVVIVPLTGYASASPSDPHPFYAIEYRKSSANYYDGGLPQTDAVVVYRVDQPNQYRLQQR